MEPNPKQLEKLRRERTLVLIKPDAVIRKIVGELIGRFERKGLKMVALKLVWPDKAMAAKHYVDTEEWLMSTGTNTYNSYLEKGQKPKLKPRDFGLNTRRKLIEQVTAGPVVAMVIEGAHAIETLRKMRGSTSPLAADVGTIGFDYSVESYELSDAGDWAIKNVIHASDSPANATREIKIWFKPTEIFDYDVVDSKIFYSKDWHQHPKGGK